MRKLKLLNVSNKRRIDRKLTEYVYELLADEEYLNTFKKVTEDVIRVECYNGKELNQHRIAEWLRGLPLSTEYITYNIVNRFFLDACDITRDVFDKDIYIEDSVTLDSYYWNKLAEIIYHNKDSDAEITKDRIYHNHKAVFNYRDIHSSASYVNVYGNPTFYLTMNNGDIHVLVDDYGFCPDWTPYSHAYCSTRKEACRIGKGW